ncbi:MAG TPA: ATP-binding protein [Planctomycetota bacterium]
MTGRMPAAGGGADDRSDPALSLRIPNDVAILCSALDSIDAFLERHGVGSSVAFTVRLAVEEIGTNIIKYAYADSARHEIEIDVRLAQGRVLLRMADDGRAFDPLQAQAPDLGLTIEQRTVGGVGIHLVRTLADGVEYARIAGWNVLSVAIRIDSGP